jgi:hypothetical protein
VHIYTQLVCGTENTCLNESKLVEFSFEYWLYASGLLYTKLGSFSSHTIPINTFWIKCINLILISLSFSQTASGTRTDWTVNNHAFEILGLIQQRSDILNFRLLLIFWIINKSHLFKLLVLYRTIANVLNVRLRWLFFLWS